MKLIGVSFLCNALILTFYRRKNFKWRILKNCLIGYSGGIFTMTAYSLFFPIRFNPFLWPIHRTTDQCKNMITNNIIKLQILKK